jgi:hypothetical protein
MILLLVDLVFDESFGGIKSLGMINVVGIMYWAPKVLGHYSCENFGIAQ